LSKVRPVEVAHLNWGIDSPPSRDLDQADSGACPVKRTPTRQRGFQRLARAASASGLASPRQAAREPRPGGGTTTERQGRRLPTERKVARLSRHVPDRQCGRGPQRVGCWGSAARGAGARFSRRVWALGKPGVEVPPHNQPRCRMSELRITSVDRSRFFKVPRLH